MNLLIVEDEEPLVKQLRNMLIELRPSFHIMAATDSVRATISLLEKQPEIDLIFLDIYIADGLSFEIFQQINLDVPVIFTTAYDQYAIRAFELNSVDYLLKPISKKDLERALVKFERLHGQSASQLLYRKMLEVTNQLVSRRPFKKNFLLPFRDRLVPVSVDDLLYFKMSNGTVRAIVSSTRSYLLDRSLDALAEELDPAHFFRANRQNLVRRGAIRDAEHYFNGKLLLNLHHTDEKIVISKVKAREFKEWIRDA